MKKYICLLICAVMICACFAACGGSGSGDKNEPESAAAPSAEISAEPSEDTVSEEPSVEPSAEESSEEPSVEESSEDSEYVALPEGVKVITNLDYNNGRGKMGDCDGPAYCVYSKVGYNKASMDVLISQMKINTVREDRRYVNAYMFLGCDIYNGSYWCNCFDTGFCWSGRDPAWHLFYNIYQPADSEQKGWYESKVRLDPTHDYRLILDTSEKDELATIIIYDLTKDKEADRTAFRVKSMKCSGTNTAYLMDFALDYPENVKLDTAGNASDDWAEITLYNTDENLYMRNVVVENVKIYSGENEYVWDSARTQNRSLWPDVNIPKIDYPCTMVIADEEYYDYSYRVDLDMNRPRQEAEE
ncbi:MAG: hypothetical protein J5760_03715 [Clostridia bacterium]|nr:hypothetical protein [Clostridia bacterium]